MIIRRAQMRALAEGVERGFLKRLAADVRRHYVRAVDLPDDELLAAVSAGVQKARSYGVTWQSTLADFVGLTFTVGPGFDEHPASRRWLDEPALPPNQRIRALFVAVPARQWREIRRWLRAGKGVVP